MPLHPLPSTPKEIIAVTWDDLQPHFAALAETTLTAANVNDWLATWTAVDEVVGEASSRLQVATTVNTADAEAEARLTTYLDEIYPKAAAASQGLKEKLLASGIEPADFEIPLRNMRAEAALFREENLPLLADEQKLGMEYDRIIGSQSVEWNGEERTLPQMAPLQMDPDRDVREQAWRASMSRWQLDREEINTLWTRFLDLRLQVAANAGLGSDYREYQWRRFQRFDYAPADCYQFQAAIEEVVKPAAARILQRRAERLGLSTLRPWDLAVEPSGEPPLKPFTEITDLNEKSSQILGQVDPILGGYFDEMRGEGLLDLESRKNKAPGGYCTSYPVQRRPFIFMNAVGLHGDVQTLLHEAGHAFHVFESAGLPYSHQQNVNTEFAEVASMSMELLAAPYLAGTFYSAEDAARARIEHLEHGLLFWPYMAVVDAFQQWVYENPSQAREAKNCDAEWTRQWDRFMPVVDWTGLEAEKETGWHRKLHIHQIPFYYVEYGIAQLGAYQVYANSLKDQSGAIAAYRHGLSLGGTRSLPDLFSAVGARFAFDAPTLRVAVDLIESTIDDLS